MKKLRIVMNNIKSFCKTKEFLVVVLLSLSLGFLMRDIFLKNKILFPSNFLASYYSPWRTVKDVDYPNGIPNKPIGGNDIVRMFYPYRTFTTESLKRGELPLWNPYNFSGSPIVANFQSAVFYPLNVIYLIMPQITAWSIMVIAQPIMGTFFMYLFLRLILSRKIAAFMGAFSFGFSGFMIAWSQENSVVGQASLWLGAVLYATEKLIVSPSKKYFSLLVAVLVFSFFAGHYQFAFYIYLMAFAYGFSRAWQINDAKKIQTVLVMIGAYIMMLLICAVQLLPSIEAFTQAPRSSVSTFPIIEKYLMPPTHFIAALSPDILGNPGTYNYFGRGFYQESVFYAGTIPFIFGLFAVFKYRQNRRILFFVGVMIISYLFSIDWFFSRWFYQLPIPVITTFSPSRTLYMTAAAISVLSAFGFDLWLLEKSSKKDKMILLGICAFAVISIGSVLVIFDQSSKSTNITLSKAVEYIIQPGGRVSDGNVKVAIRNSVMPFAMIMLVAVAVFLKRRFELITVVIVIAFCFGQFYFFNKYLVLGETRYLYPEHFVFEDIAQNQNKADRFLSFGLPILGDLGLENHVYSPDGIDPVFSSRYGQLLYATKIDGKFTRDIPRIEANLSEYADNYNIVDNQMRFRLNSLLGVTRVYNYESEYKSLKDIDKIFPPSSFTPLWKKDGWQAYQNNSALPRAFFAEDYAIETDPQKSIDLIISSDLDLSKTVVLEETPEGLGLETANNQNDVAKVNIEKYEPQNILLSVENQLKSSRLMFISDTFYPGWRAFADEQEVKIYRANYAFRAIVVPENTKNVRFEYKPESVKYGLYISTISTIAMILIWLKRDRKVTKTS